MIASMREDTGRVGVVMPHGVLFRGGKEGQIRQCVLEKDLLHAPSAVQTSAVQDSAVENRNWIVPDVHPPAGPPGGPGGSTEAENSQSDPCLSHLDVPDPGHSPSNSGRALIFAALGDEPENSLFESSGSGWWEQPSPMPSAGL